MPLRSPMPSTVVSMMRRARFERGMSIGDSATAVVVPVELDLGAACTAQLRHQFLDLPGRGDADGIGDADAIYAERVRRAIHREQIVPVGAEGIFARKADEESVRLRERDALLRAAIIASSVCPWLRARNSRLMP